MEHYILQPNEAVLFEDNIIIEGSRAENHLILTNINIVIVAAIRKIFKKDEVTTFVYPVSEIKVYNGAAQIAQKREKITVYFLNGELNFRFYTSSKAGKFMSKMTELITGKSIAQRGAGKVKNAIGLVDDTLGIDTIGTLSSAIENGLVKTVFNGIAGKGGEEGEEKESLASDAISTVANVTSAVLQAKAGNQTAAVSNADTNASKEITYEQKIENVKKLKELLDMDIITKEEFDAKKKELLGL